MQAVLQHESLLTNIDVAPYLHRLAAYAGCELVSLA